MGWAAAVPAAVGAVGSLIGGNDDKPKDDGGGGFSPYIGPAIGAGGQIVGALLGSRASGRASDAQLQATREALAFEREKEAAAQRQWEARQARLAPFRMGGVGLLQKYYGPDFYAQSQQFGAPTQSVPRITDQPRNLAMLALQRRMGIADAAMAGDPSVTQEPLMEFDPEAWKNWRE